MKRLPQLLFIAAILLISSVYVFPIWKIDLRAPQYPEGIGLLIWVNQITGQQPQDLKNINGLNHYIGMKEIVPESIPELVWMPWLFGVLIVFGAFTVYKNKRSLYLLWTSSFLGLGAIGLIDFYLWGYDYGHNLNPTAPIRVPGMTYQPPLIGSKQLLNMNALSVPDISGILVFLAMALAITALILLFNKKLSGKLHLLLFLSFLGLQSCEKGPKEPDLKLDSCAYCEMKITQLPFVSQSQTVYGKPYFFDSIECMAAYSQKSDTDFVLEYAWVTHFGTQPEWVPIQQAYFIHNKEIKSPMGLSLVAFKSEAELLEFKKTYGGETLNWNDVKQFVSASWNL